jgi:transcription initiation factor TFIID TATA-box-binding protein
MRKRTYTALVAEGAVMGSMQEALEADQQSLSGPVPEIHNLVTTCEILSSVKPIDLQFLYESLPGSYYDRKRFAAITIRLSEPLTTALLFTSGKLVVTGAKTFNEAVYACLKIVRMLEDSVPGVSFHCTHAQIQNMVAHASISLCNGQTLNVRRFYEENASFSTHQPGLFPGLVYRPPKSPVVLLLFSSGKIVVTGGKCENDIYTGFEMLWPTVRRYVE